MNISFYFLTIFHGMQLSPLISNSPRLSQIGIDINNCFSQYSFSPFFSSSALLYRNYVYSSVFKNFLNSVFLLESVDLPEIQGISQHHSNPVSPTTSFQCIRSSFSNNTTPYNGACITLTTNEELFCIITYTSFRNNEGGIGGAIYFSSTIGNATLNNCYFAFNKAQIASHAFFLVSTLIVNETQFQQSFGTMSSLQLTAQFNVRNSLFSFNRCNFFRNEGPISFELLLTSITFSYCCFLNYQLITDYPYINNFFQASSRIQLSLHHSTINTKSINADNIYITQIQSFLRDDDPNGNACMLIPTPSQTNGEKWSSKTGILTIFTICFFCVISIIGILIVSCCRCDKIPEEADNDENSYVVYL